MDYERPMTRIDSRTQTPYNTSAHFLWIGERTRELDLECGALYHAAHGLVLYRERVWGERGDW